MSEKTRKQKASIESLGDIVGLLSVLAGRGRYIVEAESAGSSRTLVPIRGGMAENGRSSVQVATIEGARRRGWIAADGASGRIGLTSAGRQALRKSRCRIAVVAATSNPKAPRIGTEPVFNPNESPLGWLAVRRDVNGHPLLSATEVAAGERLRADITFAGLSPRVTMTWSANPASGSRAAAGAGYGRDFTDNVMAARSRVSAALAAVGPGHADILIDVCGHLRGLEDIARSEGWPKRAARLLLRRALSALARHYGLEAEFRVEEVIARRLRHWGAEDYRPSLSRHGPAGHAG
jgi:hypothetical protein